MQDRSPLTRQNLLATHGRTIHLGHKQTGRHDLGQVRFTPQTGHARAHLDTSVECQERTLRTYGPPFNRRELGLTIRRLHQARRVGGSPDG